MSTRDALLMSGCSGLPEALRDPIEGVSLAAYLFVEAAHLDGLCERTVLAWLGVQQTAFARAEELWSERVADALAQDEAHFDELYQDLLTRALSVWHRPVEPLDRDVDAWITFQRHALAAGNPGDLAHRAGLTLGDEMRLARLWRERLASPEIAAQAAATWAGPLLPLPELSISPIVFPPIPEPA